jgi:hypothetical protein
MTTQRLTAFGLALSVVATASALALPSAANAHGLNSLHEHGFSSTYLLFMSYGDTPTRCGSSMVMFDGTRYAGQVEAFLPDRVTSPVARAGEYRRVFVTASLEFYSSSGWMPTGKWKSWLYTGSDNCGAEPRRLADVPVGPVREPELQVGGLARLLPCAFRLLLGI